MNRHLAIYALGASVLNFAGTGCTTTEGRPTTAESTASNPSASPSATIDSTTSATTVSSSPVAPPSRPPIGTATMQVRGGTGSATITYQINGSATQTEMNVSLPWEKQYPVYDEVQSSVTADGGDADLICSIIMDGKLLSFDSKPRPSCSFAYFG